MDSLVIKVKKKVSDEELQYVADSVKKGLKLGCVIIPEYCDVIVVPDDIEVRIEDVKDNVVEGEK